MKITVTNNATELVYMQALPTSKTMSKVMSFLMDQTPGDQVVVTLENNGHVMTYRNASVDMDKLIRHVNGIMIKEPPRKAATAE